LHNNKIDFIVCGDININYLENCTKKQQLDGLLTTHNLKSTVHFPTRIATESSKAKDNIFVHRSGNYTMHRLINALSGHDAQLIMLNNVTIPNQASEANLITK